jgi:hypothetical protein
MGFRLVIWIFCTYTTQLRTASNYSPTTNLHTSQITTACAKPFQAYCVFTILSLVITNNSGDPSASHMSYLC